MTAMLYSREDRKRCWRGKPWLL